MRDLFITDMPKNQFLDLINWFNAALRSNQNKLTHYLDNIKGQGTHLETLSRRNFFDILASLVEKLRASKDEYEIKSIINSLKWKF